MGDDLSPGNKPYRKVVITQGADPTVVAIRGEVGWVRSAANGGVQLGGLKPCQLLESIEEPGQPFCHLFLLRPLHDWGNLNAILPKVVQPKIRSRSTP